MNNMKIIPQYRVVLRDYWSNPVKVLCFEDLSQAEAQKEEWAMLEKHSVSMLKVMAPKEKKPLWGWKRRNV